MSSANQEGYDYTHSYDNQVYQERLSVRTAQNQAGFLLPHLKPGMSLLDCGCGPGSITLGLAEILSPGSVAGMDISEHEIDIAREQAKEKGISNITFEVGDISKLPYPDESFDAVFSHHVLEHMNEPQKALSEMYRVLKPGGVIGVGNTILECSIFSGIHEELINEGFGVILKIWGDAHGDHSIGKRHRALLNKAGFVRPENYSFAVSFGTSELTGWRSDTAETTSWMANLYISLMDDKWRQEVIEAGLGDNARIDSYLDAIKEWGDHPDSFGTIMAAEALAWKE